ncbi:hypothetical protein JZO78_04485 [Enterococcus ureilyticus]|uniref:hypothetical protein n=1 Tax=Enterococcus ureilyticus TaxID=1131292 RepID=UPI001A93050C|nr:hypothetical protein [Enterococcus ureilyticus]MBO0445593.1 hypothetical protein [Enterococcus ureilyticus]
MYKFLISNFEPKDFITISISLTALAISLLNFWRDRKTIQVQILKREVLKRVETFDKIEAYPNQIAGIGIEFRFLNTSKHNIGYFDLIFRDGYSKQILPCFYLYSLRPEIQEQQLLGITMSDQLINLNPIPSNYGIVSSNSFKCFGTVVHPTSDKIQITIKFAKKTLIPNLYSQTTKFSKWKRKVITLTTDEINILNQYNQSLKNEYTDMDNANNDINNG